MTYPNELKTDTKQYHSCYHKKVWALSQTFFYQLTPSTSITLTHQFLNLKKVRLLYFEFDQKCAIIKGIKLSYHTIIKLIVKTMLKGSPAMPKFNITLISPKRAKAMLTEYKEQRKNSVPHLAHPGRYILPDYKLTRRRAAFKIVKHTFLTPHYKSYVALDSDNGHTLWLHNFGSLTEALFWLETGLKISDTDSHSNYKEWVSKHIDEIETFKKALRDRKKAKSQKATK